MKNATVIGAVKFLDANPPAGFYEPDEPTVITLQIYRHDGGAIFALEESIVGAALATGDMPFDVEAEESDDGSEYYWSGVEANA